MSNQVTQDDICCHGQCLQGRLCPASNVESLRGRNQASPLIQTNTHRPVVVTAEQCRAMDDTMGCAPAPSRVSVGNTSGSKLTDVVWFWLPITARVKLLTPGVNWWRVLAVLLCLVSVVGVLSALILASGLVGPQA